MNPTERARLVALLAENKKNGSPREDSVSAAECAHWRERAAEGYSTGQIAAGSEWARKTVSDHTSGRCSH